MKPFTRLRGRTKSVNHVPGLICKLCARFVPDGSPGRKPWVNGKNGFQPQRGDTRFQDLRAPRHACAAPPALVIIYRTFPSADALGYLLNAPPALFEAVLCILDRLKFWLMQLPARGLTHHLLPCGLFLA